MSVLRPEKDALGALEQEKWIDVLLLKVCTMIRPDGEASFGFVLRNSRERFGSASVVKCTRLGAFQFFHPLPETMESWPVGSKERCEKQRICFSGCDEVVMEIH
jgi:hypothetical protein